MKAIREKLHESLNIAAPTPEELKAEAAGVPKVGGKKKMVNDENSSYQSLVDSEGR